MKKVRNKRVGAKKPETRDGKYDFSFRCPRCNGFLQNADKLYAPVRPDFVIAKNGRIIYKSPPKMYLCINCGRIWMYEKKEFTSTQQDSPLKRLFLSQQKHYANCRGAGI